MAESTAIRGRVESIIAGAFGAVNEDLVASGVVDSVRAMELLVLLEKEFEVKLEHVGMKDLATVTGIVGVIGASLGG
jgi:acyl carrier protein